MEPEHFFCRPQNTAQKKYEALRAFYVEKRQAEDVAKQFGYKLSSFYSLTRDFKKNLSQENPDQHFFISKPAGRRPKDDTSETNQYIIDSRKNYLSVPDIKAALDAQGETVSEGYIYNLLKKEGFARLPRRKSTTREKTSASLKIEAPKSYMLDFAPESWFC